MNFSGLSTHGQSHPWDWPVGCRSTSRTYSGCLALLVLQPCRGVRVPCPRHKRDRCVSSWLYCSWLPCKCQPEVTRGPNLEQQPSLQHPWVVQVPMDPMGPWASKNAALSGSGCPTPCRQTRSTSPVSRSNIGSSTIEWRDGLWITQNRPTHSLRSWTVREIPLTNSKVSTTLVR